MQNMNWFHSLKKPALAPPDWLFAPVWAILYIMIFLSLVFFLKTGGIKHKIIPIIFFIVQLLLNFSWSGVFFGMQKIGLALIIIALLWITLLITIITFYKHSKLAACLLVPYFLWVSFATYLNFEYWRLNSLS